MRGARIFVIAILAFLVLLLFLGRLVGLYTDYLWFSSLKYESVFITILKTHILLFIIFGVVFFAILWLNLRIARGTTSLMEFLPPASEWAPFDARRAEKYVNWGLLIGAIGLSLIAALASGGKWLECLRFFSAQGFQETDPIFNKDVAFYMFKIPFLKYILNFIAFAIVLGGIGAGLLYGLKGEVGAPGGEIFLSRRARTHLFLILALLLLAKAVGYFLARYGLLFSERGVALGASYTDVHARLPMLYILMVTAVLCALVCLVNIRLPNVKPVLYSIACLLALSFIGGVIFPGIVQRFIVRPNEEDKERQYIEWNIEHTRKAFGLQGMEERPFEVDYNLTASDLQDNKATIDNIRLWDHRPLKDTYDQLQTLRIYYRFSGVDTDRYIINGNLTQVMLAARYLNLAGLEAKARGRWVNRHIVYTHGYGIAMSPVNKVIEEGRPDLLVKDFPPWTPEEELSVEQAGIYFGEFGEDIKEQQGITGPAIVPPRTPAQRRPFRPRGSPQPGQQTARIPSYEEYVIVNTTRPEFDYPKGDENVEAHYAGKAGVPLSNILRRLAFAIRFADISIAITEYVTKESHIQMNRQIRKRVETLAPFLRYDPDPYIVTSEGRLYWIMDAYTMSDRYPYSERFRDALNYVRNSVKVVIDAYDGTVDFYVFDPDDALLRTYQKIFPRLFKPKSDMPKDLQRHVRYPSGLFMIQAELLAKYHMRDPTVFYNQEDLWTFPKEVFEALEIQMEPYYIIMRLPGEEKEEFLLMIPFTPAAEQKNNMLAWLCARCDQPGYGELTLFKFPKKELIFGPRQIEARIDQDENISKSLTLWKGGGSEVIRGNLLVIPIKNSLLYVEPLYLRSTEGQIPELKQVIVAQGQRLAMEDTLEKALTAVFGAAEEIRPPRPPPEVAPPEVPPPPAPEKPPALEELLQAAEKQLERVEERQRQAGEAMEKLRQSLAEIRKQIQQP